MKAHDIIVIGTSAGGFTALKNLLSQLPPNLPATIFIAKKTTRFMAYKIIRSPAARDNLHDIVVFIARYNPNRAMSFGYELISETNQLQEFPEFGRIVPECSNDDIREIIFGRIELCIDLITNKRNSQRLMIFALGRTI